MTNNVHRAGGVRRIGWNILRFAAASLLLWILLVGNSARLGRLQLALIPDADLLAEARELRARGHYAEAIIVCDAATTEADPELVRLIAVERAEIEREQSGLMRRLKDLARGALTGAGNDPDRPDAPDPSIELLAGAIATDLFVIGDVRDLVIQSARVAAGKSADPVIVALSGLGIFTTFVPQLDWAPALLKAARKSGAMTDRLAGFIRSAARERRVADIRRVVDDTAEIARYASPVGAMRLLRHVDDADDAARIARFLSKAGASGAQALRSTGKVGVDMSKAAGELRAAGRVAEAVTLEKTLLTAGLKGKAGASWLARGGLRAVTRVHPLIGIAKSIWKGNAESLVRRFIELLDPTASWSLPAAATWVFIEAALLLRTLTRGMRTKRSNMRLARA